MSRTPDEVPVGKTNDGDLLYGPAVSAAKDPAMRVQAIAALDPDEALRFREYAENIDRNVQQVLDRCNNVDAVKAYIRAEYQALRLGVPSRAPRPRLSPVLKDPRLLAQLIRHLVRLEGKAGVTKRQLGEVFEGVGRFNYGLSIAEKAGLVQKLQKKPAHPAGATRTSCLQRGLKEKSGETTMTDEQYCVRCRREAPSQDSGDFVFWETLVAEDGRVKGIVCPGCLTGAEQQQIDEDMFETEEEARRLADAELDDTDQ